jgi:GntR family transcriptional repressor for pyruvate dehydrogenase complex
MAAITEAIVSGQLRPGDQLQSERDLAEQFGVSRTVIREAVRSLAAQGLVQARSGRGVEVMGLGGAAVSRSLNLFLRGNPDIDYARIHEVRAGLEIQIAGLAAQRAKGEDLARLAELNGQLASGELAVESAAELDVEFHRAIADATHNRLFVVMLDAIGDVLLEIRRVAFAQAGMIEYARSAHALILARLNERDADGAREAMRAHLEESKRDWLGGSREFRPRTGG